MAKTREPGHLPAKVMLPLGKMPPSASQCSGALRQHTSWYCRHKGPAGQGEEAARVNCLLCSQTNQPSNLSDTRASGRPIRVIRETCKAPLSKRRRGKVSEWGIMKAGSNATVTPVAYRRVGASCLLQHGVLLQHPPQHAKKGCVRAGGQVGEGGAAVQYCAIPTRKVSLQQQGNTAEPGNLSTLGAREGACHCQALTRTSTLAGMVQLTAGRIKAGGLMLSQRRVSPHVPLALGGSHPDTHRLHSQADAPQADATCLNGVVGVALCEQ